MDLKLFFQIEKMLLFKKKRLIVWNYKGLIFWIPDPGFTANLNTLQNSWQKKNFTRILSAKIRRNFSFTKALTTPIFHWPHILFNALLSESMDLPSHSGHSTIHSKSIQMEWAMSGESKWCRQQLRL